MVYPMVMEMSHKEANQMSESHTIQIASPSMFDGNFEIVCTCGHYVGARDEILAVLDHIEHKFQASR